MEKCTNEKDYQRSCGPAIAQVNNRNVNMSHTPPMHRHIPRTPKCVNIISIPPVTVEITVGKMQ